MVNQIADMPSIHNHRISATLLGTIAVFGAVTNVMMLVVFIKTKSLRRTASSLFLLNLSVVDLLNLSTSALFYVGGLADHFHLPHKALANTAGFLNSLFEIASVLVLGVISLDRLVAVRQPLRYRACMTLPITLVLNAYVWTQALVFAIIPAVATWFVFDHQNHVFVVPSESRTPAIIAYLFLYMLCNYFFPLAFVLIAYPYIFFLARSQQRRIACAVLPSIVVSSISEPFRKATAVSRETKRAWKILAIVGPFILCSSPYFSLRLLEVCAAEKSLFSENATVFAKIIFFAKSMVNPFAYLLSQKKYQMALKNILLKAKVAVCFASAYRLPSTTCELTDDVAKIPANIPEARTVKARAYPDLFHQQRLSFIESNPDEFSAATVMREEKGFPVENRHNSCLA